MSLHSMARKPCGHQTSTTAAAVSMQRAQFMRSERCHQSKLTRGLSRAHAYASSTGCGCHVIFVRARAPPKPGTTGHSHAIQQCPRMPPCCPSNLLCASTHARPTSVPSIFLHTPHSLLAAHPHYTRPLPPNHSPTHLTPATSPHYTTPPS